MTERLIVIGGGGAGTAAATSTTTSTADIRTQRFHPSTATLLVGWIHPHRVFGRGVPAPTLTLILPDESATTVEDQF